MTSSRHGARSGWRTFGREQFDVCIPHVSTHHTHHSSAWRKGSLFMVFFPDHHTADLLEMLLRLPKRRRIAATVQQHKSKHQQSTHLGDPYSTSLNKYIRIRTLLSVSPQSCRSQS